MCTSTLCKADLQAVTLVNNIWLRILQCTAACGLCLAAPPLWHWLTAADMSQTVSVSVAQEARLTCVVRPLLCADWFSVRPLLVI